MVNEARRRNGRDIFRILFKFHYFVFVDDGSNNAVTGLLFLVLTEEGRGRNEYPITEYCTEIMDYDLTISIQFILLKVLVLYAR